MSTNNCDRCGRDLIDPQARYGWRCEKVMGTAARGKPLQTTFHAIYKAGAAASNDFLSRYQISPELVDLPKFYEAATKYILAFGNEVLCRESLLEAYNAMGFQQDETDPAAFVSGGVRPSAIISLANWMDSIWKNILPTLPSILPEIFLPKDSAKDGAKVGRRRGSGGKFGMPPSPKPTEQRQLPSDTLSPYPPPFMPTLPPNPTPPPPSESQMSQGSYVDYLEKLYEHESRGNGGYDANNGSHFGRYQMGRSALIDAGFIDKATGKYTLIAKEYGVTSDKTFLGNETAQEVAVRLYHKRLWGYIKSYGLDEFIGQEKDGITYTASGLIASAHLVGIGVFRKYIKDGGQMPMDGNGTPYTAYMRDMGGYDLDELLTYQRP